MLKNNQQNHLFYKQNRYLSIVYSLLAHRLKRWININVSCFMVKKYILTREFISCSLHARLRDES